VAGAEFLVEEAKRRRNLGGGLYLYQVKEGACETLKKGGYADEIGRENFFSSKRTALETIPRERLDHQIWIDLTALLRTIS